MRKRRRNKRGLQSKKGETVTGRLGDKEGVRIIKKNPHEWCSTKKKKKVHSVFLLWTTDTSDQISYIKTVMDLHLLFELDNKA